MEYKCLSDFLFKGENKNINISVSKNSPVNASLSLDGYKHSMVQIIALTIALKMKTVIVNPPIVSDTYVFIAIINELGGTQKYITNVCLLTQVPYVMPTFLSF